MIIKPSTRDPINQVKIAELVDEVGFPPGVWNVVHGGEGTANTMLEHPDIVGIAFVGSSKIGKDVVYPKCRETGKRAIVQGAAKNSLVVMPDADLDNSIPSFMTSFFGITG